MASYARLRDTGHRLPAGFTLHDTSHRHRGPKLYVSYRGWDADIYFYEENAGTMRSLEHSQNPGDVAPFPREYFHPRQPATFLGEPTFVPAQPEAWLKHIYHYIGPDAIRDPVTRYFRPRRG